MKHQPKVKRNTQAPVLLKLSLLSRIKVLLGWRVFVLVETDFGIYEPKALKCSSRVGIVPPWVDAPISEVVA